MTRFQFERDHISAYISLIHHHSFILKVNLMYCQLLIYDFYQSWFEALLSKLQQYQIDRFLGYLIALYVHVDELFIPSYHRPARKLCAKIMSEQVRFVILINQGWWVEVRSQNSIDLLLNDKEFNEKSICFLTREP